MEMARALFPNPQIKLDSMEQYDTLTLNSYGIKEFVNPSIPTPPSIDLVIVPGVAFDTRGGRCGHGRGYYDRWFAKGRDCVKVGIGLRCQVVVQVPAGDQDAGMDYVVSADGVVEVRSLFRYSIRLLSF
jgi:5-formyltetrahydrofolate cyclo-ligase